MTDKRPQKPNVNVMNLLQNSQYWPRVDSSLEKASEFCWSSFTKDHKNFTIIDQEKHEIKQIYIWNPMNTAFIM